MAWNSAFPRKRGWWAALVATSLASTYWALAPSSAWSETRAEPGMTVSIVAPAYWCPYACDATSPQPGFTVAVARAAIESAGHQVRYRNLPYDRALFEVRSGRIDGSVPTYRGEAPEFVFPRHAVSQSEYCFYVLPTQSWRYQGPESLESIRFVATSGYSYSEDIDAYISANLETSVSLIRGENIPARLHQLVRIGRYEALLDDRLLFESSRSGASLVNAGCLDERQVGYLALSPKDPERSNAIAEAFDRGFERARADGQLCAILQNYGLSPRALPGVSQEDCAGLEE